MVGAKRIINNKLIGLLERCYERNIKINNKKSVFNTDQLSFIGHTISREGLMLNERKIEAITKMKVPENVNAILRLQGMINYIYKKEEVERRGKYHWLVTQNVDGLHTKAGSVNVTELHGSSSMYDNSSQFHNF